ncbi:MAG TPA: AbrB/MazE/SpoVT family DNA-binding domain-containing protein [Candidatus Hydrogenedentes bacterium]|nr:AbrB/MazE/SpoVT family DNA-binding domain-containing protein [Candidatus Hydrogenedentota bacterium]HIJ74934.1 AbrB/MazE/SpoVT family DNA-binding domain-containing protein [Candidatus Hydrogenedentota bacterium]
MVTKVQKWGNSQGLRLSKAVLEDAHLSVGDSVDVTVRQGEIIVSPVHRVHGKYDLRRLVARIPKNHRPTRVDWGSPVGKEVW